MADRIESSLCKALSSLSSFSESGLGRFLVLAFGFIVVWVFFGADLSFGALLVPGLGPRFTPVEDAAAVGLLFVDFGYI